MPNEHTDDEQLLEALNDVVRRIVERQRPVGWDTGMSIDELRRLIKHHVLVSHEIPDIDERLVSLPEGELEALIDRLDLRQKFSEAKP